MTASSPSPIPAPRERILSSGLELMSVGGLSGVTLGVLAERVGMSKSGLFAHFRSKEQVQLHLLEATGRLFESQVVAPAMRSEPGLARLRSLVNGWLGWPARAGLSGGCPVSAALFELDDLEGPVRERVSAMEAGWRGRLAGVVREAVGSGEFRHNLDVDQFVWELSGIHLAHHVSRRLLREPRADLRAEKAFNGLVRRALTPPVKP